MNQSVNVTGELTNRAFFKDLGRAFGGAIIFSLPMMMTMEMWELGFYIHPLRLILFVLLNLPLLTALAYYAGFKQDFGLKDMVLDAFVAYAVGFIAGALVLGLLGIIEVGMSPDEIVGKVALQAIPGSIGAMFASSQLGGESKEKKDQVETGYFGELFLMVAGALFLAFNVAPTEEMILIAYQMTLWHSLALIVVSLLVMHAFVYVVEFRGQEAVPENASQWSIFLRFTAVGYALALLISFYMLWTFGRTNDVAFIQVLTTTLVLGFPAAIGAAAARLVL